MAEQTLIEWADATLNLWWGCTKVSEGCKFCYAENLSDQRFGKGAWGPQGKRQEVKSWRSTLEKISRRAKAENRRLRVFCSSMSDVFEGPETMGGRSSENWGLTVRLRRELGSAIQQHPHLDFLLLTKRPENALSYGRDFHFPPNVWIGTSVEDQKTADERIPYLLSINCAVRFVSCEPLLGPIEFAEEGFCCKRCGRLLSYGTEEDACYELPCSQCQCNFYVWDMPSNRATFGSGDATLDWVICGGESGPNARPMHPDWARSLRDQCQAAAVPFLFKQWGEFVEDDQSVNGIPFSVEPTEPWAEWDDAEECLFGDRTTVYRVGKKAAGRLLDGREWNEFPEVQSNA